VFRAFNLLFFGSYFKGLGQNVPKKDEKKKHGHINSSPKTWLKKHNPNQLIQIQMKN
jgi:hypothetical protein